MSKSPFAEIHDELQAVARELLGQSSPLTGGGRTAVPVEWSRLAELGWLGLEVPEALGGAGATFAEVDVVARELGRAATASSYLGSIVLGVEALRLLEPGAARDDLLRQTALGELRIAVTLPTGEGDVAGPLARFHLERGSGGLRLYGRADFVPDVEEADRLLILALDASGVPVVVDLGGRPPHLDVTRRAVLDETRRFGAVSVDGVEVDEASVRRFLADPDHSARQLAVRGAAAIACDSLGLAEMMVEATVSYVAVRHQFGRPIGSFQAVKHACADMLVQTRVSRELVSTAVEAVAEQDPAAWIAVSMAKSHACAMAVDVAGKAMQLHGGIGYTRESGLHAYLKRATLNRSLFGAPAAHRRHLATRYDGMMAK